MREISYVEPKDLSEAVKVLGENEGRAKIIAGGTNLIPSMRSGEMVPEVVVDLASLENFSYAREEGEAISIGALTTIADLISSEIVLRESPILSMAASRLGNPLTRNRATIGGNLVDASPAADMAPPLLALEASVHVVGAGGKGREIPLDRFFQGPNQTVLRPDEVMTHIQFSKIKNPAWGSHIKLGLRNAMAISVVSIAVMLEMKDDVCQKARVALGAVAPKPLRAYGVEGVLEGARVDSKTLNECSRVVTEEISPISDIRASSMYRTQAASVLLRRAIAEALEKGRQG
jgi:CO/xanthine dehydrogenase FAD-binding subunit